VIIPVQDGNLGIGHVELGDDMSVIIERIVRKNLIQYINETEIKVSDIAVRNFVILKSFVRLKVK
jgi:hypothetical protein